MSLLAIVFGVLLSVLGGGVYGYLLAVDSVSQVTALIPAFFGIPLIVLGAVARNEKMRMHAMHGAALLGLVGFAIPAYRVTLALLHGTGTALGLSEQAAMSALCLIFVGLCVRSFIAARVARKQGEAEASSAGRPM